MSELKKVDYQCLVGSQVLMGFWSSVTPDNRHIGMLTEIENGDVVRYKSGEYLSTLNCRIYQHPDYWISNHAGMLRVPDGLILSVKYDKIEGKRQHIDIGVKSDYLYLGPIAGKKFSPIIEVQVTGVADGYEL